MEKYRDEGRDTGPAASASSATADARMLRRIAREVRERFALTADLRREFIAQPEEARRNRLRRRTYYSPMDAPFLL